ncbi:hypothetical protein BSZ18_20320 [Bradyrhizobium canariense]|uniref:Peptidoglycan binding-like domain-containing protein n=1 Tax=Bradyrhizobium canariense TaxID=255045 RepID=A0A1X3H598_9BRAD|nr:hypothetical protein BSZ18_20320 [Bradyrhizobium canariense]
MIGTLQTLQRNNGPMGPALSGPPIPQPNISTSKPSISCTNVRSPLGLLLCSDGNAAKADWDVNAATWAYSGTLNDAELSTFQQNQTDWVQSVSRTCKLDSSVNQDQRYCVLESYRTRTKELLGKLRGDALEEARQAPNERAALQAHLFSLGLLRDQPDGEFGPNTRTAIKAFQESRRAPSTGFLTRDDRDALLGVRQPSRPPQTSGPFPPDGSTPQIAERPVPQTGPRFPSQVTNEADVSLARPAGNSPPTKIVEVTGLGDTPEAARKDASRLAVQQVAGVYIDNRRRVETKMSADQVSTIVEEKLLSYTNAYVSKFEPVSQECTNGNCKVVARITVNVAPLVQTLRASAVPTVEFDSNSAEAAATTLGAERAAAFETYKDLIARIDTLVTVGVGKAEVNANLPSASDSVWLTVPITFFANSAANKEWTEKIKLIADKREQVSLEVTKIPSESRCNLQTIPSTSLPFRKDSNAALSIPVVCFVTDVKRSSPDDFAGPGRAYQPRSGRYGTFATADCFGRTFVREEGAAISLGKRASNILLVVEFVDSDGKVIHTVNNEMGNFPELPIWESIHRPQDRQTTSLDYCASGSNEAGLFYRATRNGGGDTIIFPPAGSRMNALLNVKISNDKVGQIARIRATIKTKS